jgi:CheY-like chemotaxis protein
LPIVAVTACTQYGDRERALAAGCTDYVAKPIHTKDFPARVRAYLEPLSHCGESTGVTEFRKPSSAAPRSDLDGAEGTGPEIPGMDQLRVQYIGRIQSGLQNLKRSLADSDFKQIRTFGHNLAGTGTPYGFPSITEYGRALQKQAESRNVDGIGLTLSELATCLGDLGYPVGKGTESL